MLPHKQARVKVNAYVDEKIAPVVEAMSKLDSVVTFCSCEDSGNGVASVYFFYKEEYGNWLGIGEICATLSKALNEFEYARISVEWQPGSSAYPKGRFEFETDTAEEVAEAIKELLINQLQCTP
jgi:hypothetical protein